MAKTPGGNRGRLKEGQPGSRAAGQPGSRAAGQEANWQNRTLFHGDNLPFLQAMDSETVDLIATDPPFKKGRDFHATPNSLAAGASFQDRWSWERDVHEEWTDQITDDHPRLMEAIESARYAHSDAMGAYLCFMAVRLLEMHRILKPVGSIYLHCDMTASHYLKAAMDAIFGSKHFLNDIIWRRATSHNDASQYGNITDNILFYGKSKGRYWDGDAIATPKTETELASAYPSSDERGAYRAADLTGPLHGARKGPPSTQPWQRYDVYELGRCWSVPKTGHYAKYIHDHLIPGYLDIEDIHARLDALDAAGMIHHPKRGKWPGLKRYRFADRGNPPQNLILEPTGFTNFSKNEEITGFETQKPIKLYQKLLHAACPDGGIVLDPFAGCATTLVAAERIGRQWVGIDLWDKAHGVVITQLQKEKLLRPDGDQRGGDLLAAGQIHYSKEPPIRQDSGETAADSLRTIERRVLSLAPWQKLSRAQIVQELTAAQSITEGLVLCAGCGRELEAPFMELDHVKPRADGGENDISNRILLCRPCNGRKNADLTMRGLIRANRKAGWMQDEKRAKHAQDLARERYEEVRYRRTWPPVTGDLFT